MTQKKRTPDGLVDGWKCPICKREFRSDSCSHSWQDVHDRNADDRIRQIVKEEMKKR